MSAARGHTPGRLCILPRRTEAPRLPNAVTKTPPPNCRASAEIPDRCLRTLGPLVKPNDFPPEAPAHSRCG
eukprot:3238978-Amphidinium_carterae.1